MGQRTAEMHLALVSRSRRIPRFAPEPFTELYQRSLVQSMRTLARQSLQRLRRRLRTLPEDARGDAQRCCSSRPRSSSRRAPPSSARFTGVRTRYHGKLHLGQVLYTGKDFVILMSEGEAGAARRPIAA